MNSIKKKRITFMKSNKSSDSSLHRQCALIQLAHLIPFAQVTYLNQLNETASRINRIDCSRSIRSTNSMYFIMTNNSIVIQADSCISNKPINRCTSIKSTFPIKPINSVISINPINSITCTVNCLI